MPVWGRIWDDYGTRSMGITSGWGRVRVGVRVRVRVQVEFRMVRVRVTTFLGN